MPELADSFTHALGETRAKTAMRRLHPRSWPTADRQWSGDCGSLHHRVVELHLVQSFRVLAVPFEKVPDQSGPRRGAPA